MIIILILCVRKKIVHPPKCNKLFRLKSPLNIEINLLRVKKINYYSFSNFIIYVKKLS